MIIYFSFIFFVFGAIFGSFLNALEFRIKRNLDWKTQRSFCPKCLAKIKFYDNIPLFSFLFLKGKCRNCRQKISWQYPLVELITAVLFVFVFNFFYSENIDLYLWIKIIINCVIVWTMIFVFIYDFKYLEISDLITLGSAILLFVFYYIFDFRSWSSMFLSIFIGISFFGIQFLLSKGKWIGGGDIRIAIFMGVLFDWQKLLLALWLAYILGAIISIFLLVKKGKKMNSEVPLGCFLMPASFVTLFWGDKLISFYLKIIT
ncbi:MAG: prepilin peptidase [Patescibacteria group bacterium]